jgi:hypothetical protein
MSSRFYRSFEEFARDEIRPVASRVGWSLDDLDFDSEMQNENFAFDDKDDADDDEE